MKSAFVCVLTILVLITVVQGEYPPDFPKCHNADEVCLVKSANDVLRNYYGGLRDINLVQFDPLHIKSMHLERNPSSPVNIDLKFSDIYTEGFKAMQVTAFSGLRADMSGRNTFSALIPEYIFKGHYIADGRVLILPVSGEGEATITCRNLRINYSFDLKPVEKNGQSYATLQHVKLDLDADKVEFHFEGLFNRDQTLTDTTNEFLNANWKEIFAELKPSMAKANGLVIKSLVNAFYAKQPYADYFL